MLPFLNKKVATYNIRILECAYHILGFSIWLVSHILATKMLPKNFPCFGVKIFYRLRFGGFCFLRSLAYVHLLGLKSFLTLEQNAPPPPGITLAFDFR